MILLNDRRVNHVVNEACCVEPGEGWFAFWIEDCFDPPTWLVRGENFSDAYDWFLCSAERHLIAEESDLEPEMVEALKRGDCVSGLSYNDNGTLVWTEAVMGREVRSTEINWFAKQAA